MPNSTDSAIASKELPLLTSSSLKTGRGCKRKFEIEYERGYRPLREEDYFFFGSLGHGGLQAWWEAMKAGKPQEEWLNDALAAVANTPDPFDLAKAQVLLTGYHFRWKDEPFDVLEVESTFRIPLINPATGAKSRTWELGGKIDVLVRDRRDGLVKLVEHKFSSEDISPGSTYWKRLTMDGQVSTYFDGGQSFTEEPIAECLYDVILKPGQKPSTTIPVLDADEVKIVLDANGERVRTKDGKKWRETADKEQGFVLQVRNETPDEYRDRLAALIEADPNKFFARGVVVRIGEELDEHRFDTWQTAKEIHEYQRAGRFPRNPDHCTKWGSTCPYWDVCTGVASLEDTSRFRKVDDVHPELAVEETAPN